MITIVMGKPGSGKSTYLALMARKAMLKGRDVYSNSTIVGAYKLNAKEHLNKVLIRDALVIIDEAGFEFNSRDFKKFSGELYRFFTMHRHYNVDVILAVQFWDRLDIVIRELVQRIVVVKRSLFFWCINSRDINVKIGISEDEQIQEKYSWKLFATRWYRKKPAWSLFDSYYVDILPVKDNWEKYVSRETIVNQVSNIQIVEKEVEVIEL